MTRFKQITVEESKRYRKLYPGIDYNENNMSRVMCYTREPDPDDPKFDIVTYYGNIKINASDDPEFQGKIEHVYILSNPSIPGVLKIGHTRDQTVMQRVKQINSAPGVMLNWEIRYTYPCHDSGTLEKEIHAHLQSKGLRLNVKREGFIMDVDEAIAVVEELGKKYRIK
jgi:hypothetical protein